MLKLMFFTDTHIRANSPASRLDSFPEAIIKKINWVIDTAKELGVDALIHGGDWLDRPDTAYSILGDLMNALLRYGKPIYTVIGNHDIYGYNNNTFERTAMYLFESAGVIKRLFPDVPEVISKHGLEVQLTGVDANFALDKDGKIDEYINVPESNATKIHVVHGFLAKSEWPNVPSTAINSILHTKADVILTGHEHSGYGIVEKNKKLFVNPGALARVTAGVGDVNQEVKVALITVYDEEYVSAELIKLPADIARPASEVLDRSKLVEEKKHAEQLNTFLNNIQNFQFQGTFNVYRVLDEIAKMENVEPEVVDVVRDKLRIAEELKGKE